MSKYYDIVIIGGGPAGCSAAITIKKENPNLTVKIIDKNIGKVHKIGEILLTQTMVMFENIGIASDLAVFAKKFNWQKKFGVTFVNGKSRNPWRVLNNNPVIVSQLTDTVYPSEFFCEKRKIRYTFIVKRDEFDYSLREIAKMYGVEIEEKEIIQINSTGEGSDSFIKNIICSDGEKIYSNQFLDCSGQASLIAKHLKARKPLLSSFMKKRLSSRYAYFKDINFEEAEKKGFLKQGANIISFDGGWVWLAATEDNENPLVTLGVVSDVWTNETLYTKLQSLPEAELFGINEAVKTPYNYLGEKQEIGFNYAVPDYSYYSEVPFGKNWACVGDSLIFIDPLLSQGVTLAVSYGHIYGKTMAKLAQEDFESRKLAYSQSYKMYLIERDILVKLLEFWYDPVNSNHDNPSEKWLEVGTKLSKLFNRNINEDLQSFQFLINLENIHMIAQGYSDEEIAELMLQIKLI